MYLEPELFHWFLCIKLRPASIEVVVELDFFDLISFKVFHNLLGFPLFLLIKSE